MDDAVVGRIEIPTHEPAGLGSVDELHGRVMTQEQVTGEVADRRVVTMTSDREEELVLGRRETGRLGLLLAPPQEAAKPISKVEELRVLAVVEVHKSIVTR